MEEEEEVVTSAPIREAIDNGAPASYTDPTIGDADVVLDFGDGPGPGLALFSSISFMGDTHDAMHVGCTAEKLSGRRFVESLRDALPRGVTTEEIEQKVSTDMRRTRTYWNGRHVACPVVLRGLLARHGFRAIEWTLLSHGGCFTDAFLAVRRRFGEFVRHDTDVNATWVRYDVERDRATGRDQIVWTASGMFAAMNPSRPEESVGPRIRTIQKMTLGEDALWVLVNPE